MLFESCHQRVRFISRRKIPIAVFLDSALAARFFFGSIIIFKFYDLINDRFAIFLVQIQQLFDRLLANVDKAKQTTRAKQQSKQI